MLYEELATSHRATQLWVQQASIGWTVHHPNIVAECGLTLELEREKKMAWIVMELMQGSMAGVIDEAQRKVVQPLTFKEKVDLAYDSVCGLNYLHTQVSRFTTAGQTAAGCRTDCLTSNIFRGLQ